MKKQVIQKAQQEWYQEKLWYWMNTKQVWTENEDIMEYWNFMAENGEEVQKIQELFDKIDWDSMDALYFLKCLDNWEDLIDGSVKDRLSYRGWKPECIDEPGKYASGFRYSTWEDDKQIHPEGQISITLTKDDKRIQLTNTSEYANVGEGSFKLVAETKEELQEALDDFDLS